MDQNTGIADGLGEKTDAKESDVTAGTQDSASDLQFEEWKAPDGSITLEIPAGWTAIEKQVDTCTVNWAVIDPAHTKSAYMNNEIMVLKSEDARQMYRQYGITGIDNAPVSGYLDAEQSISQLIAPLSGSSNFHIVSRNTELSGQFAQAVCISGLAACDAQAFEALYTYNGTLMKGSYMVQTFDFGEGTSWWINLWGYESPESQWTGSKATLDRIFNSVEYTQDWVAKCKGNGETAASTINEIVRDRQAASESAAEEWDDYVKR